MSEHPWFRSHAASALLAAALTLLFYLPLLHPGAMQSGGDFANLFWPGRVALQAAWRGEAMLFWNPYSFLGVAHAAAMQHAAFYPPDLLLSAALPAHMALGWGVALHLALCGAGMALWLRDAVRLGAWEAGVFGAAMPCCGWFWGHTEHVNQVACAAWMPWVLRAVWRGAEAPLARTAGTLALLGGAQWLAGHPQAAFHTHLLAGPMALALAMQRRAARPPVAYGAGTLLGLGIAGVQLAITAAHVPHTLRALDGPDYPYQIAHLPATLVNLVVPHPAGAFAAGAPPAEGIPDSTEYRAYLGPALLALAAIGAWRGFRERPRLAQFMLAAFAGAVLLALGGNASPAGLRGADPGLYSPKSPLGLLLLLVPPADGFRVPARFMVIAMVAGITLAALGWHLMPWRPAPGWRRRTLASVLVLPLLLAGSWREKFRYPVPTENFLEATRALETAWGPHAWRCLDRRLFRLTVRDDEFLIGRERTLATRALHRDPLTDRMLRYQPGMPLAIGVSTVDGYEEGLLPPLLTRAFLARFNRNLRSGTPDRELLALMGVREVWTDLPVDPALLPQLVPSGPLRELRTNPLAHGIAYWEADTAGADWSALDVTLEDIRAGRGLDGRVPFPWGKLERWPLAPTNPIETTVASRTTLRLEPRHPAPGPAIIAMGRDDGWHWRARDGAEHPLEWLTPIHARVPAEAFADGPATLAFRPRNLAMGGAMSALCLAVALGLLLLPRARGQGRDGGAEPS
jgi:hypothetical protein